MSELSIIKKYGLSTHYAHLNSENHYEVVKQFIDYDGYLHPVGERWKFIGSSFLPYEAGLSLFIMIEGEQQQVRLQDYPESQWQIINCLSTYIIPVEYKA